MAIPRNLANFAPKLDSSGNPTFTAPTVFSAGTASLPSITFTGDTNTGIFSPGADTIAFTEGGAEAMRIDSSGNVGIGTTSPSTIDGRVLHISNSDSARIHLTDSDLGESSTDGSYYSQIGTETYLYNFENGSIIFGTNNTERARITSGGALCIGKTGIFDAELLTVENTANGQSVYFWSSNASLSYPVQINRATRNTTNGTYEFFRCVGAGSNKFVIADSGNATNTNGSYGTISDAKLKQDITDATPQWDDIKNLRFRKYRLKNEVELDPNAKPFLGLIAQEAELVCPGLIEEQKDYEDVEVSFFDEAGNSQTKTEMRPTGTTTKSIKTSILYMKAVKALQEAQLRIEILEAQNAAFEARLAALEAK